MRTLITLLLMLTLSTPLALAQSQPSQQENPEELFIKGKDHYNRKEYPIALVYFKESYFASHLPALLVNIGHCQLYLHQYDEAIGAFQAYLREEPNSPIRAELERLIEEMTEQKDRENGVTAPIKKHTLPFALYGASGVFLGASLITGAIAQERAEEAKKSAQVPQGQEPDIQRAQGKREQALRLGIASTALLGASVMFAVDGFWFYLREPKKKTTISITPNSATATVRF